MKYLHYTVLLFALSFTLSAQAEYSFLTDGKQWVQDEFYSDGSNPSTLTYFEFTLGETVMMNGIQYTRVFRDTVFAAGLLKEIDGRLLILKDGVTDTLLDFNLEVGDTVIVVEDNSSTSQNMVLLSVDSIAVLDGSIRKRLNFELNNVSFDGSGFGVSWIDGIGSTRGTIFNILCSTNTFSRSSGSCQTELICVKDANERLLYNSTEDEIYDCNKVDVITSNNTYRLPEGLFTVYPNPATKNLFVTNSEHYRVARIRLTDMNGRKLIDSNLTTTISNDLRIPVGGFKKGIYYLTVFTSRGEWASQRVVIQ
jgi:hypothetical protein